jgi:hypothetical protein
MQHGDALPWVDRALLRATLPRHSRAAQRRTRNPGGLSTVSCPWTPGDIAALRNRRRTAHGAHSGTARRPLWDQARRGVSPQRHRGERRQRSCPASTPTTLASFNGTNGDSPQGSLIADTVGDLFGRRRPAGRTATARCARSPRRQRLCQHAVNKPLDFGCRRQRLLPLVHRYSASRARSGEP